MKYCLLCLCFITMPSFAANMLFLKNSVMSDFSKEEITSFRQFVADSLEKIDDKSTVKWTSDSSQMAGKLKPLFTHSMNGLTCRRTAFLVTDQKSRPEHYQFDICKKDNKWQVMRTPAASFKANDWELFEKTGKEALEFQGAGQPFSWLNRKSGNSGVIVPMAIEDVDDTMCRDVAISIQNKKGLMSNGNYRFCKTQEGKWQRAVEQES